MTKTRPPSLSRLAPLACRLAALLALVSLPAHATPETPFLRFTAVGFPQYAEVRANDQLLWRLRRGATSTVAAREVARRLHLLAARGAKPTDISVTTDLGVAYLSGRGQVILSVDTVLAQGAQARVGDLAKTWAAALKAVLATPYVTFSGPAALRVPLHETRHVQLGGTAVALLSPTSSAPDIAALERDAKTGAWRIRGKAIGKAEIVLSAQGTGERFQVEVRPLAAQIPPRVQFGVSGPPLPADDLRLAAQNAVAFATRLAPLASLGMHPAKPRPPVPPAAVQVWARAAGPDLFDARRIVVAEPRPGRFPKMPTHLLLISNRPERVTKAGVLLGSPLASQSPARLLWHHVNGSGRMLSFRVRLFNLGDQPALVHVTDSASGPTGDEVFVGHSAMARYVRLVAQGAGYELSLPPHMVFDVYATNLDLNQITSGLVRLTLLQGDRCGVEVLADGAGVSDQAFQPVPLGREFSDDASPFGFEPEKHVTVSHEAGGPWTFFRLGKDFSTNLQGTKLLGDYGVEYTLGMNFSNPTMSPSKCELVLRGGAGAARATLLVDGKFVETSLLTARSEVPLWTKTLKPGEQSAVTLVTMPESGSNYPLTLILRSTP
jgi:hypothetical protein